MPVVVECEEQSDDGSLWKRFAIFRSGLVFGTETAVRKSSCQQQQQQQQFRVVAEHVDSSSGLNTMIIPPMNDSSSSSSCRCHASTMAKGTLPNNVDSCNCLPTEQDHRHPHVLSNQNDNHGDADDEPKQSESSSTWVHDKNTNETTSKTISQTNRSHVVAAKECWNETNGEIIKEENDTKANPKRNLDVSTSSSSRPPSTPKQQPLHIPQVPFTLGPYPTPLGGLPLILEETPSLCSDLTKYPSVCSERTRQTHHAVKQQQQQGPPRHCLLVASWMQDTVHDENKDHQLQEYISQACQDVASLYATSSQDESSMSGLGMGSSVEQRQNGRGIKRGDNHNTGDHYSKDDSSFYTRTGAPDSQFRLYRVDVDPTQQDRGADIPLFSFARPHMRGFHFAWMSFFVAFFTWFAMTPLLAEIARSQDFTREEIFLSSVLAVLSSGCTRVVIGPLNDAYGPRWVMACTLLVSAVPTALASWMLDSVMSLYLLRFFIGIAGSSFVTCQYWTLSMFTPEIAGTASALAAGWGNLGGGVAQIVMGSFLFPLAKKAYGGGSCFGSCTASRGVGNSAGDEEIEYDRASESAWRSILVFPAVLSLVMAYCVVRYSDDTPKGSIQRRRQEQQHQHRIYTPVLLTLWENLQTGSRNWNTFLLAFQYGCCFGVEITMTQAAAWYFIDEFGQTTESAAAIASAFGWMNLFARGLGGYCSDLANARSGLRGRFVCLFVCLVVEGLLVVVFGHSNTLGGAMSVMVVFSVFVQAAEGAVFGIVPYVDRSVVGSIAGLVGAGGNIGGACFSFLFAQCTYRVTFLSMGAAIIVSALLLTLLVIPEHKGLLFGSDANEIMKRRQKTKPPAIIFVPGRYDSDLDISEGTTSELDLEVASHNC